MRACHIVYGYFPFDPRVRREAETLRRHGHQVDVIALQEPGDARQESIFGFQVHRVPLPIVRGGFARYAYQYVTFLLASTAILLLLHARHHYRVVHIHSLPDFQVFCAAPLRLMGTRVILDLHEAMPEILAARFNLSLRSLAVRLARVLEWLSCAFADAVVAQNETIRDLLAARGVKASKLVVVMNSPDPSKLLPERADRLRAELGISKNPAIVYVGGINPERDLGLLVQAVARLRARYPIKLLVFGYGDDSYRHQLNELADREGLNTAFVLGPRLPQEQVFAHLSLSEIGPITYERNALTELTVPNKVFEYAAARKPLVIADLKTLRNLFDGAALFYRPGDVEDLVRQAESLLNDPKLGQTLVSRAERVLENCSWNIMADRLRRLYERLSSPGV